MLPMIPNNAEEIVKIAKGMRDGRMNTGAQHGTRNGNADGRAVLERDSGYVSAPYNTHISRHGRRH
jgi:hypothetical protein